MRALLYTAGVAALLVIAVLAGWRSARPRLPESSQIVGHEQLETQRRAVVQRDARRQAQADFERSLPSRVTLLRRELTEPGLRVSRVAAAPQTSKEPLFYINGDVVRQGSYSLSDGMTFRDAIEKAGGLAARGDSTRVNVTRLVDGKTRRVVVKMYDFVLPDDVIQIPRRIF